jgi:hypothetical protein
MAGWEIMDCFVLRSPGFAFGRLDALRSIPAVDAVERLAAAEAAVAGLQRRYSGLLDEICDREQRARAPRETFRALYGAARNVRRGAPISGGLPAGHDDLDAFAAAWDPALRAREAAAAEAEQAFAGALARARVALREATQDARFREAVWMSNPHMYETGLRSFDRHWVAEKRPSKTRQLERRLYAYLQRLCAKNETIGFFGPLNYGEFGPGEGVSYRRSQEPIRRRKVFVAYWAAAALASRIAAEPGVRAHLRPRRGTLRSSAQLDDAGLRALLERCDGSRDVAAIAAACERAAADALADVERLVMLGLVRLDLPIPPAELDPLAYVARFVDELPESCEARHRWAVALADLDAERTRFAAAGLDERREVLRRAERRFEELASTPARRGAGQMFEDRGLMYEECLGAVEELRLGAAHRQRIVAAVEPIAALCATAAQLRHQDLEHAARALLAEMGGRATFVGFLAAWRRQHPQLPPLPRAEGFSARLADLVQARCSDDGRVSRLTRADVEALCEPLTEQIVCSPDLMLAAPSVDALAAGEFQVVLGELHHGAQAAGWMLCFAEDDWGAQLARVLPSANGETPANLLLARRMKTAPPEFPGPSIAASAVSERAAQVELFELSVAIVDGRPRLLAADDRRLRIYPPCHDVPAALYAPFASLSYPLVGGVGVRLGAHTPRIEIAGAVYQRERWDVPASELPRLGASELELFRAVHDVRRAHGLPERVFVRAPGEPKPVYVDFANPIAVELLAQLAGQVDGDLAVSEMLPGPGDLWLQGEEGAYCCELRTVMSGPRVRETVA